MLLELHVKNLALIEKADVEFGEGLNILTGETGAGKSIIIGSVTMALGGKASKDVIRRGADHAYIELIFFVDSKEKKKALMQLGTEPTEEGMVIISRKIMPSRSVSRINDETVTMARLRQITGLLLDIHGQHEHQSLLYKSKHLEILDAYVKAQTQPVKRKIEEEYKNYCKLKERLLSFKTDEDARLREMDFLRFEIQEIENGEIIALSAALPGKILEAGSAEVISEGEDSLAVTALSPSQYYLDSWTRVYCDEIWTAANDFLGPGNKTRMGCTYRSVHYIDDTGEEKVSPLYCLKATQDGLDSMTLKQ